MDNLDLETLREFLVDRAATMDGATRMEMAIVQQPEDEQRATRRFQREIGDIRAGITERGAVEVLAINDDEWGRLIGEDDE